MDSIIEQQISAFSSVSAFPILLSFFKDTGYGSGKVYEGADDLTGKPVTVLELNTGGWSECEYMIDLLQENVIFWTMFWYSTTRGGHYVFKGRNIA